MARVYPTPRPIAVAPTAKEVRLIGMNIRLAGNTITYYYEALDAAGNVVDRRPFTEPLPPGLVQALLARGDDKMTDAGFPVA